MSLGDLNDLRLFAAVVAGGGFTAAARALAIPKSRVSRRVAALESELGVRLIERSTRRFKVTDIGQDIYRHARAALAEADSIQDTAARLKTEPQGLVRISCPPGADRLLAIGLPSFLAQYPKLRLQMIVSNRRVNLIEEGVDIAIRVRERLDTDAELQMKVIGRTVTQLVASPFLIKQFGQPADLADLKKFPTLGFTELPGVDRWTLIGPDGREENYVHEPRLAATDFAILHYAALDGLGVAFLPELQSRLSIAEGRLSLLLPEWHSREATVHLVYTSRRGMLPGVRAVIDFVAQALDLESDRWQSFSGQAC
jgi:DNA-binding transcriptional LysR family regulator